MSEDPLYRGTSLIRACHPPNTDAEPRHRSTVGSQRGGAFVWARHPCGLWRGATLACGRHWGGRGGRLLGFISEDLGFRV